MTAQEAIKNFIQALNIQNYDSITDALNDAVKAGSRYGSIQEVIDNFFADQKKAERAAIKNILGNNYKSEYDGLQLEELLELAETEGYEELKNALNETAKYSDTPIHYYNLDFTATERIRMLTAETFLKDYCGIELERYVFPYGGSGTYYQKYSTGNTDTGAITGSDAGGNTVKDSDTVVPEIGNKYTAIRETRQIINTGTNDWIVKATNYNDTINSGGADSINAAGGADIISVTGNNATISTGANDSVADTVNIAANVKNFTVADFESFDKLNIEGDFLLSGATLSDDTVTVTDATGNRTFTISGWNNAQNSYVTVNGKTLKLGKWLSSFVDFEEIENEDAPNTLDTSTAVTVNLEDVTSTSGSFSLSGGNTATFSSVLGGNVGTVSSDFPNVTTFTTQGLTVELWGEAKDSNPKVSGITTLTLDTMSTAQKTIFAGIYKWWIKEGLKLNEESFGLSFNSDGVTGANIKVFFYNDALGALAFVRNYQNGKDLELGINMAHFSNISSDNENGATIITQGSLSATYNLDRTIAHELTHAVFAANINNFNNFPQFFKEGIAELVHGIDDERIKRLWEMAGGSSDTSRLSNAIDFDDIGTGNGDSYAGGYMLLRYFAKNAAAQTSKLPALGDAVVRVDLTGENNIYYANLTSSSKIERAVTVSSDSNYSVGSAENFTYELSPGIRQQIYSSDKNWKFSGITSNNSVLAGGGNDSATITGEYNTVSLGGGNDSVEISGNNNTITGGAGSDSYTIYSNVQSLTINDFDVANDSIYLPDHVNLAGYVDNAVILGDTKIYLNNAENISDFYDMSIKNGWNSTTLRNLLGVEGFNWSAGTYYFLFENDELYIENGATSFTSVPSESYATVKIDRNKNINLTLPNEDYFISITPPDSNSHTLTIGDYSCQFTGAALFVGLYAYSGNFTVNDSFNFYDINDNTFKILTYSGNSSVTVSLGNYSTVSGLTNGASVTITDGINTEFYKADGDTVIKEVSVATLTDNGIISEEFYTYSGAYTFGDLWSAKLTTEINHYVNDYENFTVNLLRGTLKLEEYTFEIVYANNGITFNYDETGEKIVGISNFDEGESILIDNATYILSGGKIVRASDNKTYSGDFDEFISNITTESYWQTVMNLSNTVISSAENLNGTNDGDNLSVNKVTIKSGGDLFISGDAGNDTISVEKISLKGGSLNISGDEDNDLITLKNSTVAGGTLYIQGGAGNDNIVVTDSSGVQIGTGNGNDTLTFGGTVSATVKDFSAEDVISLSSAVEVGKFENGNLTLDNIKLNLEGIKDISSYEKMTVYNGGNKTTLGNLITPLEWKISNGTATYGNKITISGLNKNATVDDISLNKKVVTISAAALSQNNIVTISDGYTLALGKDVQTSILTDEGWNISKGTASYITASKTAGYILSDNKISYTSATAAEILVTISGLKSTAKVNQLSLNGNTVTVAQAATTKGKLTISEGYALNLAKGTYSGISVAGGEGIDTITNSGNGAVISVGAGNDLISLASGTSKNTIIGGAGNDSVSAAKGKNVYQYASGDGNDTISGLTANDTLQITSGEIDGWTISDKDLTLKVENGSIKIANGAGASINVLESDSKKATTYIYAENLRYDSKKTSVTLTPNYGGSYNETLKNVVTIDGAAAEKAVNITGNDKNNLIIGGAGADTLNGGKGNDTLNGGAGKDIFVYSAGKDVIADYDEGDKISIGAEYSVSVKKADVTFKIGTNTLTVKDGAGKKVTVDDSVYIFESGKIYSANKDSVTLTSAFKGKINDGVLSIQGADANSSIAGNSSNNFISGGTKADSLNGGAGNDTLTGGAGADIFIFDGGNDLITDYKAGEDKISIGAEITNVKVSGDNVIFGTANGSITVADGAGEKITTVDAKKKSLTQIYYDGYTLNEKQTAVSIASNFNGGLTIGKNLVTIDGSAFAKSLNIPGNSKANVIIGGAGNDTLNGGAGNDSLTGNSGKDIFVYSAGKDVIADYDESDKISIGTEYSVSVKKSDVTFKIGTNTLTVKDGAGKKVTVDDSVYIFESGKIYSANKDSVTLTSAFKGTIDSGIVTVEGSELSAAIKLTGNDSNNVIYGGTNADSLNGGAGNDSIFGGKGNDTLTGGAGKDVFIYSAGKDVITDYAADEDKIVVEGKVSKVNYKKGDAIFTVGNGTFTVKDGEGKNISVTDSSGTSTYSKNLDLFEDNNFIDDENNLDSITENKFAVTQIQENKDEISQLQNIIVYSE